MKKTEIQMQQMYLADNPKGICKVHLQTPKLCKVDGSSSIKGLSWIKLEYKNIYVFLQIGWNRTLAVHLRFVMNNSMEKFRK